MKTEIDKLLIEDAVKKLNSLPLGDPEAAHSKADDILCEFLMDSGFGKVSDAFKDAQRISGFWYA